MRAIYVTKFAERGNLAFTDAAPKPALDPKSGDLLVKVLACALNPGDCRLMNGSVALVMKPAAFPYIPGIDLCGVVEAVGAKCRGFRVGDRVVASQDAFTHGSFAEYALVRSEVAALAPPAGICSDLEAAALPVAGCTAVQAVKDARIGAGSRVLVVGGSGAIGSLVIQLAKLRGAAFVAATSTNTALVRSLGADEAIDYRETNWWDALRRDDERERLDAVIDCVGDDASWRHCDDHGVLKRRARFVAVVDAPDTQVRSVGELARFAGKVLWRAWNPFSRSYTLVSSFPKRAELDELVALASAGAHRHERLCAVLDPSSPYELSLASVERAVALQTSQRAKGKLVVRVSEA